MNDKTRVVSAVEMEWILAAARLVDDEWEPDEPTRPHIKSSTPPADGDPDDLWPDDEFTSTELAWFR